MIDSLASFAGHQPRDAGTTGLKFFHKLHSLAQAGIVLDVVFEKYN
jgi:hypothetical protein